VVRKSKILVKKSLLAERPKKSLSVSSLRCFLVRAAGL
jgi:hypothetical protein